ncbi:MAG: TonB-dependent receptor plug domain-containing protein, partial [Oricola sp.]|nr:TonB-dependent receptor plug domain-containing protein [Oricola sp.]
MKLKMTASIGAMAVALTGVGYAQVDTITVTAQKREENVQDVPIAVSAFDGQSLQERAVTSVSGLSNITPNVSLDAGTPFSGDTAVISAYIRGIGANDFAFNIDPGVGVYLDGVYLARSIGANQDLMDIERIEVLKGPQGTLFGRNTIGGAISLITTTPGDEFSFTGDVTTGSFELMQVRGTVNIPLSD